MARFEIRNGPSKLDLMLALFDGEDRDEPRAIHLILWSRESVCTLEHDMRVHRVSRNRETGQWLLVGELDSRPVSDTIKIDWSKKIAVQGAFSTRDRKGYLETIE